MSTLARTGRPASCGWLAMICSSSGLVMLVARWNRPTTRPRMAAAPESCSSEVRFRAKLAGWDSSEAWFWLGEVYEKCGMPVKAAECWSYCEELEERRPIREWRNVRPEWI